VLFVTGAGISADSGLPTYRGIGGLYNSNLTPEGFSIEQCLSASMFASKPAITWKYMIQIAESVFHSEPNDAHFAIAELEDEFAKRGGKVVVLTQNVDGYHVQAGSQNVIEIHGNLYELFCTNFKCDWSDDLGKDFLPNSDSVNQTGRDVLIARLEKMKEKLPPCCPECGAVIRPRIVLFEESLPREALENFSVEFDNGNGFDLVISVGTSAMFPYITLPIYEAIKHGKRTVDINPVANNLSRMVDIHIEQTAAKTFRQIKKYLH
jgi:NAD-dependent deacetylase